MSVPLVKSLPLVFTKFLIGRITFDNKVIYAVLVTTLFILSFWWVIQGLLKKKYETTQLFLLSSLPVVLAFLVSIFLPILAPQRVLFVLPFFYLLLALGISKLKPPFVYSVILIAGVSFYSLYLYQTSPRFQREQWREAVHFFKNSEVDTKIVFIFPTAFAPWEWYTQAIERSPENTFPETIAVAPHFSVTFDDLELFKPQINSANKIYLFHYLSELTDKNNITGKFIENTGFVQKDKETLDFPGVGFISKYEKVATKK